MASLSIQTKPKVLLSHAEHDCLTLNHYVRALVVASQLEDRQSLVLVLEAIPVDVTVCSSRSQAEEVLSRQSFEIIFCDEQLPDGLYSDLLRFIHVGDKMPRVVVLTRSGDWELYVEAVNKGAFDVIRTPGYPTDVEMTMIRAVREDGRGRVVPPYHLGVPPCHFFHLSTMSVPLVVAITIRALIGAALLNVIFCVRCAFVLFVASIAIPGSTDVSQLHHHENTTRPFQFTRSQHRL